MIMGIGLTYHSQGKYDLAIEQYERALRIYEKAFGVDHINTANTIMIGSISTKYVATS